MSQWLYTCVDTMKSSRDTSAPANQISAAQIALDVNTCAQLSVTHITVDTFFDYPAYMSSWVQAVRAVGKKVWFRPHWNAWEGNNGVSASMTPTQYITNMIAFINANPGLFQSGDIFDPCAEAENSSYWNTTYGANALSTNTPNAATDAYNSMHTSSKSQCDAAFAALGITGVITGIHSTSGFYAKTSTVLYPATVTALGYVCIDSYPTGMNSSDPATVTNALMNEYRLLLAARPGVLIVIGEIGYSTFSVVNDATQLAVLSAICAALPSLPNIVGMNYWVGSGSPSFDGTRLFAGTRSTGWTLRPAAYPLAHMYAQQLRGWTPANGLDAAIGGLPVTVDSGSVQIAGAIGQRSTAQLTVLDMTGAQKFRQGQTVNIFTPGAGNLLSYNQSTVETDTSGFTAQNGATLTRDTTQFWQGTASLKAACPGAVAAEGFIAFLPSGYVLAGQQITLSCYLQGSGAVSLFLYSTTLGTIAISAPITLTGAWQRVSVTATVPANTSQLGLRVGTNFAAVSTIYADGLQVESSSTATPWQGGGNATLPTMLFGGSVASSKRTREGGAQSVIKHAISCIDWHYLADKKIAATSYANQTCGFIVSDLVNNYLAAEGVIVQRGINKFTAQQSDVETSDLSGFNQGSSVTIAQETTLANVQHGVGSLKVVTSGGAFTFEQIEVHVPASNFAASQQVTISCYVKASSGTPTLRYFLQSDTGAIGGTQNVTLSTSWQRVTRTVTLPNPFTNAWIGIRFDTGGVAQAVTFWMDALQIEVAAAASTWELGGLQQSVQAGPTLTSYVVNYKQVSTCLDELATLAGYYWYIDANKVLWFLAQTTTPAPFAFDGTQAEDGTITVEDTNPLYRNGQYILGIKEITAAQTETRQGDGKTRAFTLSYPVHQVPSALTVNGVAKTLGIAGVDTGKDYYWNKGSNILTQDTAGTILISTDTLSVTYIGEFNVVVYSEDPTQVATELALEGNAGTGKVQTAVVDTTIVSATQGYQKAAALLQKYAAQGKVLEFDTHTGGLAPGQLMSVNLPAGWDMAGVQALIESVGVTADDYWFTYHVKALSGPVNDNWVQFFQRLTSQQQVIDTTAAGGLQIVALLQTIAETWTWTESVTETVTACPVFPMTFPITWC